MIICPRFRIHLVWMCLVGLVLPSSIRAELPPDGDYVRVDDKGHLSVGGERQRFWAPIGKLYIHPELKPGDSEEIKKQKIESAHQGTDALVKRFADLGFNAVRLWDAVPDTDSYTQGDGSRADSVDYFIKKAKEKGFRIWAAGFNKTGAAKAADVDILKDPGTADAWKEAFGKVEKGEISLRHSIARVWDPRLEALYLGKLEGFAKHLNKYTGLSWADDPVFGIWELTNEEWWMRKMVGGQWQKEPAFFKNELVSRWNEWLKQKYQSDEKIKTAWKNLLPGESLEKGSIILAPVAGTTSSAASMNDSNELARASLQGLQQEYKLADFPRERAEDVIHFFMDLQLAHKSKVAAAVKTWGKSCKLSPVIFDTGIGYEIQSQYLHQNADAVAHDAYVNGWGPAYQEPDLSGATTEQQKQLRLLDAERISANDGPWVNWLLKPPGISQGVPWLEQNRTEGKPFLVYETQIQQPAKYRADYPYRIAALASIQDWDWICWHYFAPGDDVASNPKAFDKPMDITTGDHPQGYHFTFDEVQGSAMRAAGYIFRYNLFKKAPNPTRFIFGRKSLYAPESMVYGGSYGESGMDMFQTTYQYGVRIEIDPAREDDEVIGPVVKFSERNTHNPYTPTEEILFDWKKGFLKMDAPGAMVFTGLMGNVGTEIKFNNGVLLKEVKVNNPVGMHSPVGDEKYIAFSVYSKDGLPLAATKKASISLVSTSFNTGFQAPSVPFFENNKVKPGSIKGGGLPVLVARVEATLEAPALNGMHYIFRDWHFNDIGSGTIKDGRLKIPADLPIFTVDLER